MKLYNEKFLQGLDEDPKVALYTICKHFMDARASGIGMEEHFEAYALVEAFITANEMDIALPPLPNNRDQRLQEIVGFISKKTNELTQYIQSEEEHLYMNSLMVI